MKIHPIQEKILSFLTKRKGNIDGVSLRDLGDFIGIGKKPQVVAHHLFQLESKGFIRRDSPDSKKFSVLKQPVSDVVYINVYATAECGPDGVFGNDDVVDKIPLSTKTFGIVNPDDYFLIKARGKSMEPMIKTGDLVLAKRQDQVENGTIAVVVHNEMPKIKKIIKNDNKSYSLMSLNQDYAKEDIYDTDDNLRIAGSVKGVIHVPTNA